MGEYKLSEYYSIEGKVLGEHFTNTVYAKDSDNEEDIIHNLTYNYAEGNLSCDCNKVLLVPPFDADQETPCGETIPYQELFLVKSSGEKINLLNLGYFKES